MPPKVASLSDLVAGKPASKRVVAQPIVMPRDIDGAFRALAQLEQAVAGIRSWIVSSRADALAPSPAPAVQPDGRIGYRLKEAAQRLGVTPKFLSHEIRSGTLPARVNGKVIIISAEALEAYARGEKRS